jgi:hypothetical protein
MLTPEHNQIAGYLLDAVGGKESFVNGWRWRSYDGETRAKSAVESAISLWEQGTDQLKELGATDEQVAEWQDRFTKKWVIYMHAGARTANPMITGPANFPVERNRKAMATEQAKGKDFFRHAEGVAYFMRQHKKRAEKNDLSKKAKLVEHKVEVFGPVKAVHNKVLERIQLIFPDKPDDETRAILKRNAFRWSRYENAWQRKLTGNGLVAARRVLTEMNLIGEEVQ